MLTLTSCLGEFTYAFNRRGADKLIAVVMEQGCHDTASWNGVVGMRLGSSLYIDLADCEGSEKFERGMHMLEREIRKRTSQGDDHDGDTVLDPHRSSINHVNMEHL